MFSKIKYYITPANHWNLSYEKRKKGPLFLLGSGPSLALFNINELKNKYTMAFNRSFIAFEDWGFEPTYFCAIDHVVNEDNKDEISQLIKKSDIKRFFFSKDDISSKYFQSEKTTLIDIDSDPENVNLNFKRKLKVANTGLFGLQVAIGVLGFKKVFLLGCDANLKDNVEGVEVVRDKYFSKSDKDINHFRPDYYGKGTIYNRPQNLKFHYPAWKVFYNRYVKGNKETEIFNCSGTSKLKFFKYVSFEEALEISRNG